VTPSEYKELCARVGNTYGISPKTANTAIGELIRKGGSAKGTPQHFGIEIKCPEQGSTCTVEKRDVERALTFVSKGKSLKDLAVTLAETIIKTGVARQEANPNIDMSGDLAKHLDRRLKSRNDEPLTRKERVGAASYAQDLGNLNELIGSERMIGLLVEDIETRKNSLQQKQDPTNRAAKPAVKGGRGGTRPSTTSTKKEKETDAKTSKEKKSKKQS